MILKIDTAAITREKFFEILTESATDVIWVLDLKTLQIAYISPSVKEIRGFTSDEVLGVSIDQILAPKSLVKAKKTLCSALASYKRSAEDFEPVYYLEYEEYHKEGHIITSEARMRLICDINGEPVAVYGISRDVTKDRQLRDELRVQMDLFCAVFDSIPYVSVIVNADGKVVDVNSKTIEKTQLNKEEQVGLPPGLVYNCVNAFRSEGCQNTPYCSKCPIRETVRYTFATGKSTYEKEGTLTILVDGKPKTFNLLVSSAPVNTTYGECALVIVSDDTERKTAEQALHSSNMRYSALFDSSTTALVEADFSEVKKKCTEIRSKTGVDLRTYLLANPDVVTECADSIRILNYNRNMLNLLSSADKAPVEIAIAKYFDPVSLPVFLEELVALDEGVQQYICDLTFKGSDGEPRIMHTITSVVPGYQDTLEQVVISMLDITDNVEMVRMKDELYNKERRIAGTLQSALVPEVIPHFDGCDVSVQYQPASAEAKIGGDFYDIFALSESKLGILIGDVAGSGLLAAKQIAAARYTIRSYAYLNESPAWVLTHANNTLCKEAVNSSEKTTMFTAFYAVVDTEQKRIRYASGGNEPPVILATNGNVRKLAAKGFVMGVWGDYEYSESETILEPNETLVFFTDGITESKSESGKYFGTTGIAEYLSQAVDQSVEEIAQGLMDAATSFAEGTIGDDSVVIAAAFIDT